MARNLTKISALVERQLPEFIASEYPKFSAFLEKYYEQLELPGQPLDILGNLSTYRDIDFYEKELLQEYSILLSISPVIDINNNISDYNIVVENGSSFPDENGYILIDDEVIFYRQKTNNTFSGCFRNVSGATKLGDLYNEPTFKNVPYDQVNVPQSHLNGSQVFNISNLFLYAFVKNFESQYLASFPEESLKPEVDKRQLLKNIRSFYQSKGTEQSIKFIFNSIVAKDVTDVPSIYYPKDNTLKSSTSGWISKYALKVKVLSGNILKTVGQKVSQKEDLFVSGLPSASAIIDNVTYLGNYDNELVYEIVLAPESVVGTFEVAQKTFLTKNLSPSDVSGDRINVFSTFGWKNKNGRILIGNEQFQFNDKNISQFYIQTRTGNGFYPANTPVYNYKSLVSEYEEGGTTFKVEILPLGILYNLNVESNSPFSSEGDTININDPGFDTRNPVVYKNDGSVRWKINSLLNSPPFAGLSDSIANISAIFEDETYFYITTSGFPDYFNGITGLTPSDQKHLKLIRKFPAETTEIYKTDTKDVGIFINGSTAYGYKDYDSNDIVYGGISRIDVTSRGSGYKKPPYVLIDGDRGASAKAIMLGEVVESIEILSEGEDYNNNPKVTITSGRGAVVTAVVTKDKITSLNIENPGEYYSSPPLIRITDSNNVGRLAEFTSIISSDGKLVGFNKISEGKFYGQDTVKVVVEAVGGGAEASAYTKRWKRNRYEFLKNSLDSNNGYLFLNYDESLGYGYSHVASPTALRQQLNDTGSTHSPILGFAYDGNPIYGPFGYSNPLNPTSSITRIKSSYKIDPITRNRPPQAQYPVGSFIEDYRYQHRFGDLDENNGRFCVTPDYPQGTYAYFITTNDSNQPVFPYILGENYYSIPVDSNYNKAISQDDLPRKIKRLRTENIPDNGVNSIATIETINTGGISSCVVESSSNNFSVGSNVFINNDRTEGFGCIAEVDRINGKTVESIESQETRSYLITTENPVYLFDGSILTQENSNATGEVVGNIFEGNRITLRNVSSNFNQFDQLNSATRVIRILADRPLFYSKDSTLRFTNGKQVIVNRIENNNLVVASNPFDNGDAVTFPQTGNGIIADKIYYVKNSDVTKFQLSETPTGPAITLQASSSFGVVANSEIARGQILEEILGTNTVRIRVIAGEYSANTTDYLRSSTLDDTLGARIFRIDELSKDITISNINKNIAIVKTTVDHNLTENDLVFVDVNPNDVETTTTYHVRKRIYQKVKLETPTFFTNIDDTGIGSSKLLNSGADYANGGSSTYTNVELIFADQNKTRNGLGVPGNSKNARATITVNSGKVTNVSITSKGSEYVVGDLLTVSNSSLQRITNSLSQSIFYAEVSHVGLGSNQNKIFLNNVDGLSANDYLKVDNEIIKVISVDTTTLSVTIQRPFFSTTRQNHFNGAVVELYSGRYNFTEGDHLGPSTGDPYVKSYDPDSQELLVYFDINQNTQSINPITFFSTFRDSGSPSKLIKVNSILETPSFRFEFSKNTTDGPWLKNPIIEVQKYYKYKFVTSNPSLSGTYLEFSTSGNYNLIITETNKGSIIPGSGDENTSFITVKFGYGSAISSNNFTTKKDTEFTKIFYFDKAGVVNSEKSYLSLIDDPLQGEKKVVYVSSRSFVYEMSTLPQYDGSGFISYTTSSNFAIGSISSISIKNPGQNYKKLPTVCGARVSLNNESTVSLNYNSKTKKIVAINVIIPGKNYINPTVALIYKNRVVLPKYRVVKNNNGSIVAVINEDKDLLFDNEPQVFVIENSLMAYFGSDDIGTIKNIKILENGSTYYDDFSILPYITSNQFLIISNFGDDHFVNGEIIEQYKGNNLIASAKICTDGFRNRVNVLKVTEVKGEFFADLPIIGTYKKNSCMVRKVFFANISPQINSYYNNQGYYNSDKGKTSTSNQRLTDSYFFQDYSYVIKSKTTIDVWKKLIKQTVHPAGFNLFGEVSIDSEAENSKIPTRQPSTSSITIVELWDENINKITVESTTRKITQNILSFKDSNVRRGKGSVYLSEYDTSETLTYVFRLAESFDGDFDESGNRSGRTTFQMVVPRVQPNGSVTNVPLNVSNINNLIITLDGILQEPEVAYKISGSQIIFSQAPLGQRISQSQVVAPQSFVGRFVKFKANNLNNQYFRKIKNIDHLFDSSEVRFPLYYDDGSNVSLGPKENLLVSLDGVLQENKMTPLIPATSAYYINRNVTPNEIVFTKPPVALGAKGYQHFFAYSVGNYERLKIDSRLIADSSGPFLMTSVLNNNVINVDNDRNILVFVDGILQIRNRAYTITGPYITFSNPLKDGQNVNILFLYGKDIDKRLTFYNYEENNFFNLVNIIIDNYSIPGGGSIQQLVKALLGKSTVYQGDNFISRKCIGEVVSVYAFNSTDYPGKAKINLRIKCQNNIFSTNYDLKITDYNGSQNYFVIDKQNIVSISPFEEDEETREYVRKIKAGWLFGTSLPVGGINGLDKGDLIKVDGEKEYRSIIDTPSTLYKVGHRESDVIQTNHEGEVVVTSYDGVSSGVGLSVAAKITNGSVTSLSWNNRDYELAEKGYIKPSTAYGYLETPELVFIPQPELDTFGNLVGPVTGGGASGYVVMVRGEIIDVVLTNGGSGYNAPPKVLITRGYDIIKNPEKLVNQYTVLNLCPQLFLDTTISRVITQIRPPSLNPEIQTLCDLRSNYDSTRVINIVLPKPEIVTLSDQVNTKVISQLDLRFKDFTSITSVENKIDRYYELGPRIVSIVNYSHQTTVSFEAGLNDVSYNNFDSNKYENGTLGNSFETYENIKYADIGVAALSEQNTIEMMELHYASITIGDFTDRAKSSISLSGSTWDATWPSIQEHGAYLNVSIDSDDDVISVSNTNRFPSSGQLILGGSVYDGDTPITPHSSSAEIIYYTGKTVNTFTGVSRGKNITIAQPHAAGTYLRSLLDEYRFDFQVQINGDGIIQYPSFYYTSFDSFIQLIDNVFIPRGGSPFSLL